jgi:hypothetical protein
MVLRIRELPDGEVVESFRSFIENFLVRDWEYFGNMIILYDPTGVYGQIGGVEAPSKLETTVKNILEAVRRAIENAKSILGREPSARVGVLIILPTDLYNALSNDTKGKLESYRLDAPLNDVEFLAGLIREYTRTSDKPSGCKISDEELGKLAGKVAGFDSGHALIARLVGEELVRNNCNVGEVEKLVDNAKGKAEKFITQYINKLFKVDKDPNVAEALVEIFALRKPFVNEVRPGDPILTPGIVELIGKERRARALYSAEGGELRSWLARRQHDLIEEAIMKLLDCIEGKGERCEDFGSALELWKTIGVMETLSEVSEKVSDEISAVKYFVDNYGKDFTTTLGSFDNKCWKRAAFIIGHALAGHPIVPGPEDFPESLKKDDIESLGDALNRCGVDYYLLVGNVIPPLIMGLAYTRASTEAFIDKYNEAVAEVRRVLNIARDRGISVAERLYGLGLALIIAKAVELNKDVESGGADAALRIASSAIKGVILPILIRPILDALVPLRGKTPHRYIVLLALASDMENLDRDMVEYILGELNEILDNYGDVVKEHAWSLVYAIVAYANLLSRYPAYFSDKVGDVVRRVVGLLNELDKLSPSLGVIAWAYALVPALIHGDVRGLMERALHIDVVDKANNNKANEILVKLNDMRERVQELISDEEFMGYVESKSVKADEEVVKKVILETASFLKQALAIYRRNNDELYEAARLFNEAAKESREIGAYENYLINCSWVLRTEAIKGLVGDELVNGFRQLYEEAFNKERFSMPTAPYLSIALTTLGDYLVSLALAGDHETISKLPEEHWWVLNANEQVSALTRLTLNALLGHRVELSGKLKGRLSVNPEELINAFESHMHNEFRPALRVALGIVKLEGGVTMCVPINDSIKGERMVCGDSAVEWLRWGLVNDFRELLIERFGRLKELGVNVDKLLNMFDEFMELVVGLDGKSLVQLIAPGNSIALLALMLHALVNDDEKLAEKLAKAHALIGAVNVGEKLPTRLFLETYEACCDLSKDEFRRAIAGLFFFHV